MTILAPDSANKTAETLKVDLEKENEPKLHHVRQLGRSVVFLLVFKFGEDKKETLILNKNPKSLKVFKEIKKCQKCISVKRTTLLCWNNKKVCLKCGDEAHIRKDCKKKRNL